jgi:GT2 family glycosyltransferase
MPDIRVVANPNVIMSHGLNLAASVARGGYLAILSAHSAVPSDYLERVLEISQETRAANVGGRVSKIARSDWGRAIAAATTSPFAIGDAVQHFGGKSGPADSVFPGFIVRSVYESVGGFNEALACNEDDEFNARLRAAGHLVWYDDSIRVTYRPRESPAGVWRQHFRYGRWKLAVARTGLPGYLRPRHVVPSATVIGFAATGFTIIARSRLATPGVVLGLAYCVFMAGEAWRVSRLERADPWRTAAVFPIVHSAYGLGFLRGVLDRGYPVEHDSSRDSVLGSTHGDDSPYASGSDHYGQPPGTGLTSLPVSWGSRAARALERRAMTIARLIRSHT